MLHPASGTKKHARMASSRVCQRLGTLTLLLGTLLVGDAIDAQGVIVNLGNASDPQGIVMDLDNPIGVHQGVAVIVMSGVGTRRHSSISSVTKTCTEGSPVLVSSAISGGSSNNTITGSAFCDTTEVAKAEVTDPGLGGVGFTKGEGTQTTGTPKCSREYTGSEPDSSWVVSCVFF